MSKLSSKARRTSDNEISPTYHAMMNPRVIPTLLLLGLPVARAQTAPSHGVSEIVAAAERGGADAQFQLARVYLHGEGQPKNPEKSFELMKAAADQGHADAIGGLGYFYSIGLVVEKDPKQAAGYFRKGAEKGSAKAMLNLGKTLLVCKEIDSKEQDPVRDEALQWIKKAADQGLPEAGLSYGRILYYGDYGVPKDVGTALIYLKSVAEFGVADAQNMLGAIYQHGAGGTMDEVMAGQWYRKAALQGYVKAQANLGAIMSPLAENKETRIEALAWLVIASDQGDISAQKSLQDAVPGLKPGEFEEANRKAGELRKLVKNK